MPVGVATKLRKSAALDFLLLIVILSVAAALRFYHLDSIPNGFHGDEALSGIEGERILREGSIGPYSEWGMGQPTGPLYLTALSLRLFGSTIWAVRAVSALVGTVTVGVLYLMVRRYYEATEPQKRTVALASAAFLATLHWHFFYSRIGFPLITWPLCTLLAASALLEATRRRQARWWALAGFVLGLGIYSYNAHVLCALTLGLWSLFYLSRQRDIGASTCACWLSVFALSTLIAILPMVEYAFAPKHHFFAHINTASLFRAPSSPWKTLSSPVSKIVLLLERYVSFWTNLSFSAQKDGGDGSGVVPIVPLALLALAALGLVRGWKTQRQPLLEMSLLFVLLAPLGPATTLDGMNRRAFDLAPFLAMLAAIGLVALYRWGARSFKLPSRVIAGGTVLLFVGLAFQSGYDYFVRAMPDESVEWTFSRELVEACAYMNTLPRGAHIYFYSDRWSCDYATAIFLTPHISVEDRSRQFGHYSFEPNLAKGKPYFVLMGQYKNDIAVLQKRFLHNHIDEGPLTSDGKPAYIAFYSTTN